MGVDFNGDNALEGAAVGAGVGTMIAPGIGTVIGGAGGAIVGGFGNSFGAGIGDSIFGNDEKPGLLGTGQFKGKQYGIDQGAFNGMVPDGVDENGKLKFRVATAADASQNLAQDRQTAANAFNFSGQRQGPQMQAAQLGPASQMQASQFGQTNINRSDLEQRAQQSQLAQMQMQAAQGKGPSVATMQLNQGLAANLANQRAAAASQRGFGSTAVSAYQLQQQAANANANNVAQSAQMRVGETLQARQQLNDVLNSSRGQDIGVNQAQANLNYQTGAQNAQLRQQAAMQNQSAQNQFRLQQGTFNQAANTSNVQSQLQMYGLNDAAQQDYFKTMQGQDLQAKQDQMAYQALMEKQQEALNNVNSQAYESSAKAKAGLMSGIMGGIGL